MDKEDRKLISEGEEWNCYFYEHLGYMVAEGNENFKALAFTMKEINQRREKTMSQRCFRFY